MHKYVCTYIIIFWVNYSLILGHLCICDYSVSLNQQDVWLCCGIKTLKCAIKRTQFKATKSIQKPNQSKPKIKQTKKPQNPQSIWKKISPPLGKACYFSSKDCIFVISELLSCWQIYIMNILWVSGFKNVCNMNYKTYCKSY